MVVHCDEIIRELEDRLADMQLEIDSPISLSEESMKLTLRSLASLKEFTLSRDFKDLEEEIFFFKELKPKVLSKLIYHNAIYKIETKKPFGGTKIFRKYLLKELVKLKRYFDNNLEFYKYYRTGSTYLDHKYFVRGKYDIKLTLDTYYFESDHTFSTSHDYKVAKIIANDQIQVHLENELAQLFRNSSKSKARFPQKSNLKWTAPKVALIELIYALHSEGVFNNGAVDLKDIAQAFEHMFRIDLGQYRRTFLEIRVRKSDRTRFLDKLKDKLTDRMENADD